MGTGRKGQADTSLQAGATLQNRYLIQGVLGVGGMGSVYRARDMRFPNVVKVVAVKEILNVIADPSMREMIIRTFEREANTLATLDHPAIPKIYDYFSQGDRSFLVQEYIEGKDLEAYLNDSPTPLPEEIVVDWALQLCDVLAYLHGHPPEPIIFRDMKPSNVMLDHHNRIRLIDFGIARTFSAGQKGTMIGTEGYSPPEQYRGEASPAGDIYALGATLHHLLTKQDPRIEPPFSFAERPIRKLHPGVSLEFEAIINTALNYNPSDRFANAQAMKEALMSLRRTKTGMLTGQMGAAIQPPTIAPALSSPTPAAAVAPPSQAPGAAVAGLAPSEAPGVAATGGEVKPIWSFKCEDELRGSPAFANGTIFIGAYDNNLYAVNAAEGKLVWKYATDGGLPGWPAIYQDIVFIGSEDRRLHAISAKTGRVQWTYYTDGPVRSSPRIAEGHAFVGSDDNYLHAVNINSGRRAWRVQASGAIRCRPTLFHDQIFFGCESGDFYCVDFSGEQKWRAKSKRAITSSPLFFNGTVYFASMDNLVYALEATAGWKVWTFRTNKPIISSPAVEGNLLFVGSADNSIYAVDVRSGREQWRYETGGQVTSSPAVHKGVVYVGSVDGHVYALEATNGRVRWKFRSGGPITSSPVIANDIVYIGSTDNYLYALTA
jgi:outer membrane protein assembly factor BamB/tRNA A-37 threonylcarbamoyl transferase component Bud32